jgi:UDP:flavonoid glycosyltransferase YjiC (YdhE family)
MPEQGSVRKFQNAVDALSTLPVRGVVTVGDSVNPADLRPSHNVVVFATADHDDLMRRASLVLTHGGHGTFMRALKNGLPVVVVTGLAVDQPINAAAAEDWRVGRAVPDDASAEVVRDAVTQVLGSSGYRERAARISAELAGVDGASNGADEIESLLSKQFRKAS